MRRAEIGELHKTKCNSAFSWLSKQRTIRSTDFEDFCFHFSSFVPEKSAAKENMNM